MKHAAWIVLGLVLGFLLGGIGPRRELGASREKVATLETDLAKAKKSGGGGGGRGRFLPFPGFDDVPTGSVRTMPAKTPRAPGDESPEASPDPSGTPARIDEAFQLAVDAQRLRARQSRAALEEKARLDRAEMARVDDIMAKMNVSLAKHADELLAILASDKEPEAMDFLALSHDVTGILLESQTALQETLGADYAGVDPSAREVWNYVDLEIFRPALESGLVPVDDLPPPPPPQ